MGQSPSSREHITDGANGGPFQSFAIFAEGPISANRAHYYERNESGGSKPVRLASDGSFGDCGNEGKHPRKHLPLTGGQMMTKSWRVPRTGAYLVPGGG